MQYMIDMGDMTEADPVRERIAESLFTRSPQKESSAEWANQNWAIKASWRRMADSYIDTITKAGVAMVVPTSVDTKNGSVSDNVDIIDGMIAVSTDLGELYFSGQRAGKLARDLIGATRATDLIISVTPENSQSMVA